MHQGGELFGLGLTGQYGNASAVADAKRGSNLRVVNHLNALALEESRQPFAVLAGVAAYFVKTRQVNAAGL